MEHGASYIAHLLKYALLLSGYSMPQAPLPQLVELTHAQMIHQGCDDHRSCAVFGYYKDDDVIYVDPFGIKHDGTTSEDAVIVHELTHWLQHHHGKAGFTCTKIGFREREAYDVQKRFTEEIQHRDWTFEVPGWDC